MKMKNTSDKYNVNRATLRHGHKYSKYKMCLSLMMIICVNQHYATFEAQLMRRSTNTEAELKKALRIKKRVHQIVDIKYMTNKTKHNRFK